MRFMIIFINCHRDGSSLDFNEQTTRTAMEYCPTSGFLTIFVYKCIIYFYKYFNTPHQLKSNIKKSDPTENIIYIFFNFCKKF